MPEGCLNTIEQMHREILARRPSSKTTPSLYGERVMPVLEFYRGLDSYEARQAFQGALDHMLQSEAAEERSFAVDVCLGFFSLRHAADGL